MEFAKSLYYAIVSMVEMITFGTSETLLSIITGVFVGYASIKLVLFIDQKRARSMVEAPKPQRKGHQGDVDLEFMTDYVDSAAWGSFDFGIMYMGTSVLGSLLVVTTLNAGGLIAYAITNLVFAMILPVWEMRKRTIRLIYETICETEDTIAVDKRLSRNFYKKLIEQYKPGRNWAEFFTYTNYVLERNLEYIRTN